MKSKQYLIIIFLVLSISTFAFLKYEKDQKIDQYINAQTKQYLLIYKSIYHQYKQQAELIFSTKINTNQTKTIFKNRDRKELYEYLKDQYIFLKKYNLKQLHFHLPNNDSFLRFHRPNKFGDNLTSSRETVAYVNKIKKPIDGFEEGRIFNGYRFVYPLFDNDIYIGSVEVSFGSYSIIHEIIKHFKVTSNFLISKEVVDKKVFMNEKLNYINSMFDDFYFEKSIVEIIYEKYKDYKFISKDITAEISKKIFLNKPFGVYDNVNDKLVICIPVSNPVTKKVVASVMIDADSSYIQNKILNFYIAITIFSILFAFLFYILYREIVFKAQLKENNQKLKTIIQEADSGIAIMDLEGNFLETNHIYTKLLGYSKEEFKKLNCIELTEDKFKFAAKQMIEDAKEKGSISKFRKDCISKEGSLVHLELSLNLLPSKETFAAVINSLDDKIKTEEALNKFKYIFNFTSVGFLIVDDKREIVDVNLKLCEMFGYQNKNEIIGQNARIFHIDDEHYIDYGDRIFAQAMANKLVRVEFELKKQDGRNIWCELSGSPMSKDIKLKNGGVLWAVVDISEKVMAEGMIIRQNDKLQELNKNLSKEVETKINKLRDQDKILIQQSKMATMGEMMDAVAHQWKQPLSIIKLSTSEIQYMQDEKLLTPTYLSEVSTRIEKQVDHLVETIDEFRDFFRPKTNIELVSIKEVIDSALLLVKDDLVKNTISVEFIGDITIKAKIIPNEFKHIIINFLNNSKDEFVSKNIENRKIVFELEQISNNIILKIIDNAGGIPNNIIKEIFKVHVTTKKDGEGTGIGLYMTKNIIEKIEGTIEVQNVKNSVHFQENCVGACFKVEIPCK